MIFEVSVLLSLERAAEADLVVGWVGTRVVTLSPSLAMSSLKSVLVKVIRTSTGDAERRKSLRFESSLPIEISSQGQRRPQVKLVNLSPDGALIRCVPALEIGDTGLLMIQGYDQEMPFKVRSRDGDSHHIEFDLNHREQSYRTWFDRNFSKAAA